MLEKKLIRSNRLTGLDALRGLCALLVVVQHAIAVRIDLNFIVGSNDADFYLDLGRIGVAAFFLISGYVIPFSLDKNSNGIISFWYSRFFRLWPAYWISIFAALLLTHLTDYLDLRKILVNFTMLQSFFGIPDAIGVFWTLAIELVFYFVLTLVFLVFTKNLEGIFSLLFYSSVLLTVLMAFVRFIANIKAPVAIGMALSLMFFAATLRRTRLRQLDFPVIEVAVYILSLPIICFLAYGGHVSAHDNAGRWIVAYFCGLLIFLFFEKIKIENGFLLWLGSISYSIYLLHSVVIDFLKSVFPETDQVVLFLPILFFTFLSASACFVFVERPAQRFGKRFSSSLSSRIDGPSQNT